MGSDYDGSEPKTECLTMPLENLTCNFPKCLHHSYIFGQLDTTAQDFRNTSLLTLNYNTTVGSTIGFQCNQEGHKFRLEDDSSANTITFECIHPGYNDSTGVVHSQWKWNFHGEMKTYMPNCTLFCHDDPPSDNPPKIQRHWDGLPWKGSQLYYKCHEGKLQETLISKTYLKVFV